MILLSTGVLEQAALDDEDPKDNTTSSSWKSVWETIAEHRHSPIKARPTLAALAFGQLIAFSAAVMNATSYSLARLGVKTQFFQLFWMYLLLAQHLWFQRGPERGGYRLPGLRIRLRLPWWTYLLISILDVVPNFLALVAFRYTSLTSTTLLGSSTVPSTMFFTHHLLGRNFVGHHYLGGLLCVAGGILTVWSDVDDNEPDQQPHSYIGDVLALGSALVYGLGDVVAEYAMKHLDRVEYLGMLGFNGMLLTGLACPLLETPALADLWSLPVTLFWHVASVGVLYVVSVIGYYLMEAVFLERSDATLLNLSLQAVNLWAIVFTLVVDHQAPSLWFYVAAWLAFCGVLVYEIRGPTAPEHEPLVSSIRAVDYCTLQETSVMIEC